MRRAVIVVLAASTLVGAAALLPLRVERHRYPGSVEILDDCGVPGYRKFRVTGLDEKAPEGWPLALTNVEAMIGLEDRPGTVTVRRPLVGAPNSRLDFDDGPTFPLVEVAAFGPSEWC